jgi:hypothetical protein
MKMLFSPKDSSEVKLVKKKLSEAGIRCQIRKIALAQGVFGVPPYPELWIEEEGDILKALKLVGSERLRKMTVIFPTHHHDRGGTTNGSS